MQAGSVGRGSGVQGEFKGGPGERNVWVGFELQMNEIVIVVVVVVVAVVVVVIVRTPLPIREQALLQQKSARG